MLHQMTYFEGKVAVKRVRHRIFSTWAAACVIAFIVFIGSSTAHAQTVTRSNLNNPNGTCTAANFGKITRSSSPRILQMALKVEF
jgi:hypothetical protein